VRYGVLFAILAGILWHYSPTAGQTLQKEPRREAGSGVTGAFEGWYRNADGTYSLLFGYFNRNTKQELDIPIGPANRSSRRDRTAVSLRISSQDGGGGSSE
jgi:hypothetical protein